MKLNIYRLYNRVTKKWWQGEAQGAQEACQKAGWLIGDCWVRRRTPVIPNSSKQSGYSGGGWTNETKKEGI